MAGQWVHLDTGQVLVATSRGAWFQRPEFGTALLAGPMPSSVPGTLEAMRHLLDGAIAAAERSVGETSPPPPLSAERWAWHLIGQWHCAHHSVALLPELIERFERDGRADLADFARVKLEEEQGHDQFPLADLRALGYDADALVQAVAPPPSVPAGVDYARQCVAGEHPVEFFGYVYALERRVLRLDRDRLAALQAALPPGVEAASGVRLHATDLDVAHVADALAFIAELPAGDRTMITLGSYRTTRICCGVLPGQYPSEAEIAGRLARFERAAQASGRPSGVRQRGDDS